MTRSQLDDRIEELAEALGMGLGRFLSGRDMDGIARTDATFLKPGSRVLPKTEGKVSRAAYRPGWQRLGARLIILGLIGGGSYSYSQDPQHTLHALEYGGTGAAGLTAAGAIAYALWSKERRELMREWVRPLHLALAGPLDIPEQSDPRRYLHIPLNFSDDDAKIRIDLPVDLKFNESAVAELIVKKLALEGVSFSWKYAGKAPYVLIKKALRPPNKLLFKDPAVRELVSRAPEPAPLIGLGSGNRTVSVNLDDDSPHVLVAAGTGGGKSVILRTIASQLIRNGALTYILDFKRISHPWARGVPGVTYCRDIFEIHDALIHLGAEGRRRIGLADQLGIDADLSQVGPRIAILLEEVNATMKQLARYWEKVRERDDPKTSPAIDALAEILFMGRQVRLHVLLVAQSATARALGGPEMRENFATRILARYTQNAWRMLAPEVHPAPKSTRHTGRAQVVLGGIAHETQVLFMTHAEAHAWATGSSAAGPTVTLTKTVPPPVNTPAPTAATPPGAAALTAPPASTGVPAQTKPSSPVNAPSGTVPPPAAAPPATTPAAAIPAATTAAPPGTRNPKTAPASPTAPTGTEPPAPAEAPADEMVGLRQAQQKYLPDITLTTLRWARANDPDFPDATGKRGAELLYQASDLRRWARNRPRAGADKSDASP
ncbi:pRL2-11 [Streptomyces blastmyceticus]|uniref:pRL2-11 n=1 Tax=Streptomyces blastmyceticus TaxID=68180 RepID=UPI0031DC4EF3